MVLYHTGAKKARGNLGTGRDIMQNMFGWADWQWYGSGIWTLILVTALWWHIGYFFVRKLKFSLLTKFFLSPVIGVILLSIGAFVAGSCHMYWLVYVYAGAEILSLLVNLRHYVPAIKRKLKAKIWRQYADLLVLMALGLALQLPAIFGSGLMADEGMWMYFTNNSDGLMHVGFIQALTQEFPAVRPEIDIPLSDYHYWSDLVMAQLVRLGVPALNLFCQFIPVILSVATTGLVYAVGREITGSKKAARWVTLVNLVASEGAFWLTFFFAQHHGWAMATFDNGADQFLNMPAVFAKWMFWGGWVLWDKMWRSKSLRAGWWLTILAIVLPMFKVYWWILLMSGWAAVLVSDICFGARRERENVHKICTKCIQNVINNKWQYLAWLVALAGGWWLLSGVMTSGGQTFVWSPWVWAKVLLSNDHLAWDEWALRQQMYASSGFGWHAAKDYVLMIVVGVWYVFGARLLAWVVSKKVYNFCSGTT